MPDSISRNPSNIQTIQRSTRTIPALLLCAPHHLSLLLSVLCDVIYFPYTLPPCSVPVKTRRAPARLCRDARGYGPTTTAIRDREYIHPLFCLLFPTRAPCLSLAPPCYKLCVFFFFFFPFLSYLSFLFSRFFPTPILFFTAINTTSIPVPSRKTNLCHNVYPYT